MKAQGPQPIPQLQTGENFFVLLLHQSEGVVQRGKDVLRPGRLLQANGTLLKGGTYSFKPQTSGFVVILGQVYCREYVEEGEEVWLANFCQQPISFIFSAVQ